MKLITNFLLYILVGFAAYFLGSFFKKRFPIVFKLFFIAAPGSTLVLYGISLLGAGHGQVPAWLTGTLAVMRWVNLASLMILGYGLGYLSGRSGGRDIGFLIRGLSIQLGLVFVGGAVEQYNDIVDIKKFFLTSGYTIWFMSLILSIELAFGMMLLFNLGSYTKLFTVGLLLAVMVGALVTHFRRGDPFNAAIAAMELALKCLMLLSILISRKIHSKPTCEPLVLQPPVRN
jgi:DoxX-like family